MSEPADNHANGAKRINHDPQRHNAAPPGAISQTHIKRAGTSTLAWVVLLVTVVVGTAGDLVTKHFAFEHLTPLPVVIDKQQVLAKKAAGLPLNHREPLSLIAIAQHNDMRPAGATPIEELGDAELLPIIPPHAPTVVVPYGLEFTLVLNEGAVFGSAAGKRWWFVGFTFIALVFAVWVFARLLGVRERVSQIGVGLVIAGGLGNLYDRIVFACVRDFLHPLPGVKMPFGLPAPGQNGELWPYVSNVADALLLVGVGILMIRFWRGEPRTPAPHKEVQTQTSSALDQATNSK